ncbi:MAG: hypothetical protein KGL36_10420 [Gammaproteobacteria bacterium]|nr:hypothetical protein [Gammaproteobacteria bacterium]
MRSLKASSVLVLLLALVGGRAFADSGVPIRAVWKEHRVEFTYLGRTSSYSCDGLIDKVRALMTTLGARSRLHIVGIGCPEYGRPGGPDSIGPSLSIRFFAPALPDAAQKSDRGDKLAPVDAAFVPFKIVPDAFRNMSVGDCELVEEFADRILPLFTTRSVEKDITCVPYQLSGSDYSLRGDVLQALPANEARAARAAGSMR